MKIFGEKKTGVDYRPRTGSYGVLIEENGVGVVRSDGYETFFLIGGGLDDGETETESLAREAREEIGYEIEIGEKLGAALEYFYSAAEKRDVAKECHFYRISLVRATGEAGKHELVWIAEHEIERMHHRCYRWIIDRELKRKKDAR
jgi:8-oxo-dGTP diphosphatase